MLDGGRDPDAGVRRRTGITVDAFHRLLPGPVSRWTPPSTTCSALDPEHGYLAVQAYLDRTATPSWPPYARPLAARTGRPTTSAGVRAFLHSTGQYHKGGRATGVVPAGHGRSPSEDLAVPTGRSRFDEFLDSRRRSATARSSPSTAGRCCGCTLTDPRRARATPRGASV